jgi:hypothetical protein
MNTRQLEAIHVEVTPGLISDDTEFKIGQAGWTLVDGVRPFRGHMETVRGFEFYTTSSIAGKCRGLFAWRDNSALLNLAIGTNTNLYVEAGGLLADIGPFEDALTTEDGLPLWAEDDEPLITESLSGNEDGFGGAGYGTGAYGSGTYGQASSGQYYPLTWTFGQYGEWLISNPRGGYVYVWKNDLTAKAVRIPNAPLVCDSIIVTDRHIIAYGCSEELSGVYNPRAIRWCDFEDIEDWSTTTTNNAGEYILDNAGRIVRAMQVGSVIYVWTDDGLYVQQFVGQPGQTYFFDKVASGCGLAGPNAVTVLGQTAYWMSIDRKFWYMPFGMPPMRLIAPIAREVADNVAASQEEKIYATTRTEFNEVRWHYPDARDGSPGLENSRMVSYNVAEKKWGAGISCSCTHARTAAIDQGVTPYPVATSPDGSVFYEERGFSGNGGALGRKCRSGFFYVAEGARVMSLRRIWPNFDDRQGAVSLTLYGRMEPDGAETTYGPYTVAAGQTVIDLGTDEGLPTAAMFAVEWASSTAPTFWRLGKITLNGIIRGRGLR